MQSALQKRVSAIPDLIQKVESDVNLVDVVKIVPTSVYLETFFLIRLG